MSTPVKIDPTKIPAAASEVTTIADRFLGPKVRTTIYTATGVVAGVALATAPVLGGTTGHVLDLVAQVATVISSAVAVSHISK